MKRIGPVIDRDLWISPLKRSDTGRPCIGLQGVGGRPRLYSHAAVDRLVEVLRLREPASCIVDDVLHRVTILAAEGAVIVKSDVEGHVIIRQHEVDCAVEDLTACLDHLSEAAARDVEQIPSCAEERG